MTIFKKIKQISTYMDYLKKNDVRIPRNDLINSRGFPTTISHSANDATN